MSLPASSDLIAVALSGGVDSAVAAALLQQQGRRLIGITMTLLPGKDATADAEKVADYLDIRLHRCNLVDDFDRQIVMPFITSYLEGQTPNPCVRCNRLVKFGLLLEQAAALGATKIATGHYARLLRNDQGQPKLFAALDKRKDQSYFLAAVGSSALEHALFPLGEMAGKDEVRMLAQQFGLPVAHARESQDVCFLPDSGYVDFLESRSDVSKAKGLIVHRNGSLLGRHNGFWRYTVGQRKGLGIAWHEPLYVLELNAARNRVVVGEESYLYAPGLLADDVTWLRTPGSESFSAQCKIRYRHAPVGCTVELEAAGHEIRVRFDVPQRAVTPGQTVVLYDNDEVLGAGRITGALEQAC